MAAEVCTQRQEELRKVFQRHRDVMVMNAVLEFIIGVVAFLGNLLVIRALWKASSIPANLKKLFFSLALSDLALGSIILLHSVTWIVKMNMEAIEQSNLDWICPVFDTVSNFLFFCLACASFLNICAITVDRLLTLFLHLRYQELVTSNRVLIAVVSLWLTSVVGAGIHITLPKNSDVGMAIAQLIGLFVTTVAYIRIYKVVKYHRNQIESHVQLPNAQTVDLVREKKSAFNALIVYVVFVACYLPGICLIIPSTSSQEPSFLVAKYISFLFIFLNSSLNPSVYCWRYREIRVLVKSTVKKIFCVAVSRGET